MWGLPKYTRAVRLERDGTASWPMTVEPLDEPDGGTFYRPEPPNWITGSGTPDPGDGDEGDYFLDTTSNPPQWYGPKGPEDEDPESETYQEGDWPGPNDLPDAGEGAWITGSGDPENENGEDGDYYLDTSGGGWWGPKSDGSWAGTGPNWIIPSWIEFEAPRPRTSGLFSIPAIVLGNGDPDDPDPVEAEVWLEFADADENRILYLQIGNLSTFAGEHVRSDLVNLVLALIGNEEIFKARWVITGGANLTWSGSGSLVQLA